MNYHKQYIENFEMEWQKLVKNTNKYKKYNDGIKMTKVRKVEKKRGVQLTEVKAKWSRRVEKAKGREQEDALRQGWK